MRFNVNVVVSLRNFVLVKAARREGVKINVIAIVMHHTHTTNVPQPETDCCGTNANRLRNFVLVKAARRDGVKIL